MEVEQNYIRVYQGQKEGYRLILSKSDFFTNTDKVISTVYNDKIVFTRPSIDFNGTTQSITAVKSGWSQFGLSADIPTGTFYFELMECNEDVKTCYFEQEE